MLCKASRTTSGSDSYFTVEQLFTNSDYLLKPRAERLPPINVEVQLLWLVLTMFFQNEDALVLLRKVVSVL